MLENKTVKIETLRDQLTHDRMSRLKDIVMDLIENEEKQEPCAAWIKSADCDSLCRTKKNSSKRASCTPEAKAAAANSDIAFDAKKVKRIVDIDTTFWVTLSPAHPSPSTFVH